MLNGHLSRVFSSPHCQLLALHILPGLDAAVLPHHEPHAPSHKGVNHDKVGGGQPLLSNAHPSASQVKLASHQRG